MTIDTASASDAHEDYAALLSQIELFADLDRVILAKLATDLEAQRFPADTVIFRQGDPSDAFYLIVSGRIARLVANADGLVTRVSEAVDRFGIKGNESYFKQVSAMLAKKGYAPLVQSVLKKAS